MMKSLLLCALLLLGTAGIAQAQTTVILVRHAEKIDESRDPLLSETGQQRAAALRSALEHGGVSRIYVTQYRRTADTAAPLAALLGIAPTVVEAAAGGAEAHARAVAERIRADGAGTVLVVGHSNTVPAIIAALGGPAVVIGDEEYHHFFVLQLNGAGVQLFRSRY
jgi:broad specificity phosphatase PhoE